MKEIIAIKDKRLYYFLLIASFVTICFNGCLFFVSKLNFEWFKLTLILMGTLILCCVIFICLPSVLITKYANTLIISQGMGKQIISLDSIISIEPLSFFPFIKSTILLEIKTEKGEKRITIIQVKDRDKVINELNNLIKSSI